MKKHSSITTFLKILLTLTITTVLIFMIIFIINNKKQPIHDNINVDVTPVESSVSQDSLLNGSYNNEGTLETLESTSNDTYKDFHHTIHSEYELTNMLASGRKAYIDDFVCLNQYPELPTGCEVTSLTMVLNFLGFDAEKTDIANNYLKKEDYPDANPNTTFVGTPFDEASFGCFAPVITDCANLYGAHAINISGASIDQFCQYIENGQPVIVWATMDMDPTDYGSSVWIAHDGQLIIWPGREHCLVMTGFDTAKDEVYMADPLTGEITTYSFSVFYKRWLEQGCQGVIVSK